MEKNHEGYFTRLPELAIDLEPELQVLRVRSLLFGHQHSDGAGGRGALGLSPRQPLLLALFLHVPGGHVQAQSAAGHAVHGRGLPAGAEALAHHHPRLELPVQAVRVGGHEHRRAQAVEAPGKSSGWLSLQGALHLPARGRAAPARAHDAHPPPSGAGRRPGGSHAPARGPRRHVDSAWPAIGRLQLPREDRLPWSAVPPDSALGAWESRCESPWEPRSGGSLGAARPGTQPGPRREAEAPAQLSSRRCLSGGPQQPHTGPADFF